MSSKLREALEELESILSTWIDHLPPTIQEQAQKAIDKSEAILDEPPLNCEVGTADEQMGRYRNFCKTYSSCRRCPCQKNNDITTAKCFANWSQMPYVGEVEKTK